LKLFSGNCEHSPGAERRLSDTVLIHNTVPG
jgi:hypothetical protein